MTAVQPVAQRGEHWFAASLFVLVSGVAVPLLVVTRVGTGREVDLPSAVLQILIVLLAASGLGGLIARDDRHPLALVFYVYVYVWLGLAGTAQLFAGQNPLATDFGVPASRGAAAIVVLGILAYRVGARLGKSSAPPVLVGRRATTRTRVLVAGWLAVVTAPYFVLQLGGVGALLASRAATFSALEASGYITAASKSTGALLGATARGLPFLALLSLWLHWRARRASGQGTTVAERCLFAALLLLNLVVNNPVSNARYWFGTVAVGFLLNATFLRRKGALGAVVVLAMIMTIVVFPYADRYRGSVAAPTTIVSVTEPLVAKGDYDSLAQVQNAVNYTGTRGLGAGRQLVGAVLFFVPRTVWPSKPIDTGTELARFIDYPNENLSAPLWAELYVDFGPIGVALGFFVVGLASRRLDAAWATLSLVPAAAGTLIVLGVPVLAGYQVILLRGSLLQAMGGGAALALIAVLLAPADRTVRARRQAPQPADRQLRS